MNILIVANHYAVCSARYAADAFTRLGHTVRHVGQPMGRNIWGMQVPPEYVWEPTPNGDAYPIPDVVIVMDSDPAVLDHAYGYAEASQNSPVIVWGVDNHVRDYRRPWFDHYFLAHKSVSVMDWGRVSYGDLVRYEGGKQTVLSSMEAHNPDMTWLPCAFDPVAFPPSPIAWAERQYDVCMIGVMYERRRELVNAMRAAGLKVLAGTGLVYEAYRDAYHNSRVALVSSHNGDLPIRLFEGAGMGCTVLCDDIPDLRLLDPTNPIIHCQGDPSGMIALMVDEAKALQNEPHVAVDCAQWAQGYTWDVRAQVVIDWLEARS